MLRSLAIVVTLCAVSLSAFAAGLRARLNEAEELVRAGEVSQAVEAFQALQVDYPEEPAVIFGLASAQYRRGETFITDANPQEGVASFQEARTSFDRILEGEPNRFSSHAAFNRANCIAKIAATIPEDQFQQAVAAYRAAASAYDAVLKEHPDYEAAQRNLDHVRYRLKTLLQNPPEDQDQEEQPQDSPEDSPPQKIGAFLSATTDIKEAEARVSGDNQVLELVLGDEE